MVGDGSDTEYTFTYGFSYTGTITHRKEEQSQLSLEVSTGVEFMSSTINETYTEDIMNEVTASYNV